MYLINLQGKESIYEQIKAQIIQFVKTGVLRPGDKLPSVRALSTELGINPNTVARAYTDLEKDGIVYTLNKKGVFVKGDEVQTMSQAHRLIASLKREGYRQEELIRIIEEVYKEEELC